MEIITVHGQDVQPFIDDQQGQIIIIIVVVKGATFTLRVNVSWLFIADHSEFETAGAVERESRKQQVRDKVARPVNRSGFHNHRQNSWNWSSSMTRWTRDSKESSGQVVLRHGPRAQVLRERERKK